MLSSEQGCHPVRLCVKFSSLFTARKQSFGQGNIFTSVCHSVHRGGALIDRDPWTDTPSWILLDRYPPLRSSWTETPCTVTSGRYASYWNAFLFGFFLLCPTSRSNSYLTFSECSNVCKNTPRICFSFLYLFPLSDGYRRFSVTILISIICTGQLWKTFCNSPIMETDTETDTDSRCFRNQVLTIPNT